MSAWGRLDTEENGMPDYDLVIRGGTVVTAADTTICDVGVKDGVVVALGTGKTNDDGKKIPFEVKKGDRVLVSKYGGTEIKIDGKEYKILGSDDILAVIE